MSRRAAVRRQCRDHPAWMKPYVALQHRDESDECKSPNDDREHAAGLLQQVAVECQGADQSEHRNRRAAWMPSY